MERNLPFENLRKRDRSGNADRFCLKFFRDRCMAHSSFNSVEPVSFTDADVGRSLKVTKSEVFKKLESLIQAGAIVTMPDEYRVILANAAFAGRVLWWHEAFGREHIVEIDLVEVNGPRLNFRGQYAVTIGPLEGREDEKVFDQWNRFLRTSGGSAALSAIEEMKVAATT